MPDQPTLVFEATEPIHGLNAPRGTHFVFHHNQDSQFVCSPVFPTPAGREPGPELDRVGLTILVSAFESLSVAYSSLEAGGPVRCFLLWLFLAGVGGRERVSQTITAEDDDSAIAELLRDLGCRMPEEG